MERPVKTNVPTNDLSSPLEDRPLPPRTQPGGLTIRAREPSDWQEVAALLQLPRVRWGTLRLPFVSREETRKWMEKPPEGHVGIVAVLDGQLVGAADVTQYKGRRSHAGGIGICVHDDFHRRGIGSGLLATLVDVADNWLNLRRLELTVYVDNEPAIRLYEKFGFAIEGTRRNDAFRDGAFADAYAMARLHGF
jgi:L-phenylalanine/L-methionine N-acetyltransferase